MEAENYRSRKANGVKSNLSLKAGSQKADTLVKDE